MNSILRLFFFLIITNYVFGQNKSVLIQSHLNTKIGSPIEKANVVIDKVGSCITTTDGKCFYPTLKGIGSNISIKVEHDKYVPINTIELKSYRLSNRKIDTVQVIMSLIAEREQYALAYFEKEAGLIIRKRFEDKEKGLYAQINGLVAKMNGLKESKNLAYQKLEISLVEANKQLELLQKDKLNEESIAQRLASTLSMIEGEEIPDYISQAYNFFRQGNVEGADKALNGNAIDDQIVQAKLKKKIAKLLDESADRQLKSAIASCLFKAQLKSSLYKFKEAEIWFEKAYQADSSNDQVIFEYATFLNEQNRFKTPEKLLLKLINIYESLSIQNFDQYTSLLGLTLNNLGIYYKKHNFSNLGIGVLEKALIINDSMYLKSPSNQALIAIAQTCNNLGEMYLSIDMPKKALPCYIRALNIYQQIREPDQRQLLEDLAGVLNNLGNLYTAQNMYLPSKQALERALQLNASIYIKYRTESALDQIATNLINLGMLFNKNNENGLAIKNINQALSIYDSLSKYNPNKYLPYKAGCLSNLGNCYRVNNKMDSARFTLENAINIYEILNNQNPNQFSPYLAGALNSIGVFYQEVNLKTNALKSYEKALTIYRRLSLTEPKIYDSKVAETLSNLGSFYLSLQNYDLALSTMMQSLVINEALVSENPEKYLPSLASTLNNLGNIYNKTGSFKMAFESFERCIQIYEQLVKKKHHGYLPQLAVSLGNLGELYRVQKLNKLSDKYIYKSLTILDSLAIQNPSGYLPNLAATQINYSLLLSEESDFVKMKQYMIYGLKNFTKAAILSNNNVYWQRANLILEFLIKFKEIESNYITKLELQKVIIEFIEQSPFSTKDQLSIVLMEASQYAIFCYEYKKAEEFSLKALEAMPQNVMVYTNLSLALLLQNRWAEAKQIYQEKQNLIGNNEKPLKEAFLNDLIELEKAGIKHPDFEKVRQLFKQ